MQNVGPHRTFKSNLKKKKKTFSRPTDPASRRASMDKQTIFFYWPKSQHITRDLNGQVKTVNSLSRLRLYPQIVDHAKSE